MNNEKRYIKILPVAFDYIVEYHLMKNLCGVHEVVDTGVNGAVYILDDEGCRVSLGLHDYIEVQKDDNKLCMIVDVKSDGLFGDPYVISASVQTIMGPIFATKEIDRIQLRVGEKDIEEDKLVYFDFAHTHDDMDSMLKTFSEFVLKYKDAEVVWHMGHVVEVYTYRLMVERGYIDQFDAPYMPVDLHILMQMLHKDGIKGDSISKYVTEEMKLPIASTITEELYSLVQVYGDVMRKLTFNRL